MKDSERVVLLSQVDTHRILSTMASDLKTFPGHDFFKTKRANFSFNCRLYITFN